MSLLQLIAGPNGAGKTTLYRRLLHPQLPGLPFVNADVIAERRWPDDTEAHGHDAARIAAETRDALIEARLDFVAETVFSHPSKVDLVDRAIDAGYDVRVHVVMIPLGLSSARVQRRVQAGGHAVPEDKLGPRYERLWPLIAQAAPRCHRALLLDNSRIDGPRQVASFRDGVSDVPPAWPDWSPPPLLEL